VAPFDADDLMHPRKLERQLACARVVPEAGLIFSDFIWHNIPDGKPTAGPHCLTHNCFKSFLQPRGEGVYFLPRESAFESLMHDNYIGASTVMFSKHAWRAAGGYHEKLGSAEDLEFSLRMSEHFHFGYVDEVLYRYRIHDGAMSANKVKILIHAIAVLQPYWNKCDGDARRGLCRQLGEMEIDLIWHSIDEGRFGEATQHWWRALCYGGLWRQKLLRLTGRLMLHAALTMRKKMAAPRPKTT
jgi:hypothetical protein